MRFHEAVKILVKVSPVFHVRAVSYINALGLKYMVVFMSKKKFKIKNWGISSIGVLQGLNSPRGISSHRHSWVSLFSGGHNGVIFTHAYSVGTTVSAKQLHIPGAAIGVYKGYFDR